MFKVYIFHSSRSNCLSKFLNFSAHPVLVHKPQTSPMTNPLCSSTWSALLGGWMICFSFHLSPCLISLSRRLLFWGSAVQVSSLYEFWGSPCIRNIYITSISDFLSLWMVHKVKTSYMQKRLKGIADSHRKREPGPPSLPQIKSNTQHYTYQAANM